MGEIRGAMVRNKKPYSVVKMIMNAIATQASPEQLRARLELRRSNAAAKHVNRQKQAKKGFGKGGRNAWKKGI